MGFHREEMKTERKSSEPPVVYEPCEMLTMTKSYFFEPSYEFSIFCLCWIVFGAKMDVFIKSMEERYN